jgi:hypothetical protein
MQKLLCLLKSYRPKANHIIRAVQILLALISAYYLILFHLLNRGQGGHGDEAILASLISTLLCFFVGIFAYYKNFTSRTYLKHFLTIFCELFFFIIYTLFLVLPPIPYSSHRILSFHFCSEAMLEKYPSSMLACRCGYRQVGECE